MSDLEGWQHRRGTQFNCPRYGGEICRSVSCACKLEGKVKLAYGIREAATGVTTRLSDATVCIACGGELPVDAVFCIWCQVKQ